MTQVDGRPQFAAHSICMFHTEFVDMPRANCPVRIVALGREPRFSNFHAGGPEPLFAGKDDLFEDVFFTLEVLQPQVNDLAG